MLASAQSPGALSALAPRPISRGSRLIARPGQQRPHRALEVGGRVRLNCAPLSPALCSCWAGSTGRHKPASLRSRPCKRPPAPRRPPHRLPASRPRGTPRRRPAPRTAGSSSLAASSSMAASSRARACTRPSTRVSGALAAIGASARAGGWVRWPWGATLPAALLHSGHAASLLPGRPAGHRGRQAERAAGGHAARGHRAAQHRLAQARAAGGAGGGGVPADREAALARRACGCQANPTFSLPPSPQLLGPAVAGARVHSHPAVQHRRALHHRRAGAPLLLVVAAAGCRCRCWRCWLLFLRLLLVVLAPSRSCGMSAPCCVCGNKFAAAWRPMPPPPPPPATAPSTAVLLHRHRHAGGHRVRLPVHLPGLVLHPRRRQAGPPAGARGRRRGGGAGARRAGRRPRHAPSPSAAPRLPAHHCRRRCGCRPSRAP